MNGDFLRKAKLKLLVGDVILRGEVAPQVRPKGETRGRDQRVRPEGKPEGKTRG